MIHSQLIERNHTTPASDQKEKPIACGIFDPAVFFLVCDSRIKLITVRERIRSGLAGEADYLVSGDDGLLGMNTNWDIPDLSTAELLEII